MDELIFKRHDGREFRLGSAWLPVVGLIMTAIVSGASDDSIVFCHDSGGRPHGLRACGLQMDGKTLYFETDFRCRYIRLFEEITTGGAE